MTLDKNDNVTDNEVTGEAISEVLTSMANTFRNQDDARFGGKFEETFGDEKLSPSKYWSKYGLSVYLEKSTFARQMVERVYPDVERDKSWLIEYMYENHEFVKRFLSQQLTQREGMGCSVDKTHHIIGLFIKTVCDPNFVYPKEQTWYLPQVNTLPVWVELIHSLPYVTSGQVEKLMTVIPKLDKVYLPDSVADTDNKKGNGGV